MENKKHTYKVRPGYRGEKLLIEFGPDSSDKRFVSDLLSVLAENGMRRTRKQNLVLAFNATNDSPCGPFDVYHDGWSSVTIWADDNQDAIHYVDRILSESGRFRKEEVDYEDYA